jgi:colanic acid biosynthesis glycosyl transferase WcaI
VCMGNDMVGIVHPCKVYGAMGVSRPVLFFGPAESHIGELLQQHQFGWRVSHDDVAGAQRVLREILATPRLELQAMGRRAAAVLAQGYGKSQLLHALCDVLQKGMRAAIANSAVPVPSITAADSRRAA